MIVGETIEMTLNKMIVVRMGVDEMTTGVMTK
jgi:hypothetical protein